MIYRVKRLEFEDGKMKGPELDPTDRIIEILEQSHVTVNWWVLTVLVESP